MSWRTTAAFGLGGTMVATACGGGAPPPKPPAPVVKAAPTASAAPTPPPIAKAKKAKPTPTPKVEVKGETPKNVASRKQAFDVVKEAIKREGLSRAEIGSPLCQKDASGACAWRFLVATDRHAIDVEVSRTGKTRPVLPSERNGHVLSEWSLWRSYRHRADWAMRRLERTKQMRTLCGTRVPQRCSLAVAWYPPPRCARRAPDCRLGLTLHVSDASGGRHHKATFVVKGRRDELWVTQGGLDLPIASWTP